MCWVYASERCYHFCSYFDISSYILACELWTDRLSIWCIEYVISNITETISNDIIWIFVWPLRIYLILPHSWFVEMAYEIVIQMYYRTMIIEIFITTETIRVVNVLMRSSSTHQAFFNLCIYVQWYIKVWALRWTISHWWVRMTCENDRIKITLRFWNNGDLF